MGVIEEEEEIEKAPKIALDLERKINNEKLSHPISKINFSKYLPNSEVVLKIILRLRIMQSNKELLWLVGIIGEEKEVPGSRKALSSP